MLRVLVVLLMVWLLPGVQDVVAAKRVALVIGNSAYQHATPLANPKNDASDMTQKLEAMGFEVVQGLDQDLKALRDAIRDFVGRLESADMALFFYAGHGMQVNGENFIVPIDAKLKSFIDLEFEAVPMNLILSAMERTAKVNLIFLDACRDNPLADNLARSMGTRSGLVGRGLARLGSGVGSLISFATQPGNVALDGTGRNSPFTTALLKHLGTPGQDIARDLVYVRREVLDATGGKQVPWENSSLTGEVVLVPAAKPDLPATVVAPAEQKPDTQLPAIGGQMELSFWESIKDSAVKELYEAYLRRYPNGTFAEIARVKIQLIDAQSAQKASQPERTGSSAENRQPEIGTEASASHKESTAVAALNVDDTSNLAVGPTNPMPDTELIKGVQNELSRLGCLSSVADGKWGPKSSRALETFAKYRKVRLTSIDPTVDLLNLLKTESSRVCPLICRPGYTEKNGTCIRVEREVNKPQQKRETDDKLTQPEKSKQKADTRKKIAGKAKICYRCKHPLTQPDVDVCTDGDPKAAIFPAYRQTYVCKRIKN